MREALRLRLIDSLLRLPDEKLAAVESYLTSLTEPPRTHPPLALDWPHAPPHRLSPHGTYMVTAGTYERQHVFRGPERLDVLQASLLALTAEGGWQLEAWAVFSNHYHFVAHASEDAAPLRDVLRRLHGSTAVWANGRDGAAGRQVWHNFWDTRLTFESSYLARLNYVMQNAVKHGLVPVAAEYPWCSARWSAETATPAQVATVSRFRTDRVKVEDDFDPE